MPGAHPQCPVFSRSARSSPRYFHAVLGALPQCLVLPSVITPSVQCSLRCPVKQLARCVMLLLEQKIRIMEHKNLGEQVFAAERINKKRNGVSVSICILHVRYCIQADIFGCATFYSRTSYLPVLWSRSIFARLQLVNMAAPAPAPAPTPALALLSTICCWKKNLFKISLLNLPGLFYSKKGTSALLCSSSTGTVFKETY